MDLSNHSLQDLFGQLGLPAEAGDIERFVGSHRPLPEGVKLWEASFWSTGQAQFLREEIAEDADWAEVVDQLNLMLRS
jgi:hypothetical protein